MNLKDIVIDYELAVKLKELGVKQKCIFAYDENKLLYTNADCSGWNQFKMISAFTSDELLTLLPIVIDIEEYHCGLKVEKYTKHNKDLFTVMYDSLIEDIEDLKLSNALAKMLIHLVENDYVKVDILN